MNENKLDKSNKKNIKSIVIAVSVILIIVIIAIVTINSNKSSSVVVSNQVNYINEPVKNQDGVIFEVTNVRNGKKIDSKNQTITTENNFILITIRVTNTSNNNVHIYDGCGDLYSANGVKYTTRYTSGIPDRELEYGIAKTFNLIFETPTTTEQDNYKLKIGYASYTPYTNRVEIILKTRGE